MSADFGFKDADETGSALRASLNEVDAIKGVGRRDLSRFNLPIVGKVFCVSVFRLASRLSFRMEESLGGAAKSTAETRGLSIKGRSVIFFPLPDNVL